MMSNVLVRIKRAVLAGQYVFSEKARIEMEADGLMELDVAEFILNAVAIYKTTRSRSLFRKQKREYLYVIQSTNPIFDSASRAAATQFEFIPAMHQGESVKVWIAIPFRFKLD